LYYCEQLTQKWLFVQLPPIATVSVHNDRAHANAHVSTTPILQSQPKSQPTFGIDLAEQMARDNCDVPAVMRKCCQAIETYGLTSQGIYRLSGTTSKVAKLKERLDKGQPDLPHRFSASSDYRLTRRSGLG
jgi:hypothetical protein